MKNKKKYLLYILFSFLSMLINLLTQKGVELFFVKVLEADFFNNVFYFIKNITTGIFIQLFIATIAGFVFKYIVDKILIFKDTTKVVSKKHLFQVFLYTFFAVFTTLIFWGTELAFKYFFEFRNSEYIGAALGLAVGYTLKFFLDKRFVFTSNRH